MQTSTRVGLVGTTVVMLLLACTPQRTEAPAPPGQESAAPAAFKRITTAIRGSPTSLVQERTQRSGGIRGLDGIQELTHAGLTYLKADGIRAAQLSEAVPTIENGLWKVFPDGRMETTWRIKATARWHDGTPVTANDFLFTSAVEQDKDLEIPPYAEHELIEGMTAPDARTLTVTWKRPYIEADGLFSYRAAGLPIPKHVLEKSFNDDKGSFLALPYWNEEFVGTGAFKVQEWVRDSYTTLRRFDDYVLGQPKIDEIEVRFIPDNNAILANVLAGVDLTLGKTISLDIALGARDQWKDGSIAVLPQNWTPINPQFINPDPPIVADLRFRRALLQALDRQQLADFVFSGYGSVAHSYVDPATPLYHLIEPSIVRYEYDSRAAAQTIEGLGYTKRSDGFFYDGVGQRLSVSIYAGAQNDIHPKTVAAVAAMWQPLGVAVDQVLIPIQRAGDREYRANYPSFDLGERRNSLIVSEIWRLHSSTVSLPENRYTGPGNTRYRNAEHDALLERYMMTIPMQERMQALGAVVHHQTENLVLMPLFHGADPTMISNRLVNVTARGDAFTQAWNVHEWDVK